MNLSSALISIGLIMSSAATVWFMFAVFSISLICGLLFYVGSWMIPLIFVFVLGRSGIHAGFAGLGITYNVLMGVLWVFFLVWNWKRLAGPFLTSMAGILLIIAGYVTAPAGEKPNTHFLKKRFSRALVRQPFEHGVPREGRHEISCRGFGIKEKTMLPLLLQGMSPADLLLAVRDDRTDELRQGLIQGLDPNASTPAGETLLMEAASMGHTGAVEILLEFGADPDIVSERGETALIIARMNGRTDIVKMLEDWSQKDTGEDDGQFKGGESV